MATASRIACVTRGRSSATGRMGSAGAPGATRSAARWPVIATIPSLTYSNRQGGSAARRNTAPGMSSTSARNSVPRSPCIIASARSPPGLDVPSAEHGTRVSPRSSRGTHPPGSVATRRPSRLRVRFDSNELAPHSRPTRGGGPWARRRSRRRRPWPQSRTAPSSAGIQSNDPPPNFATRRSPERA